MPPRPTCSAGTRPAARPSLSSFAPGRDDGVTCHPAHLLAFVSADVHGTRLSRDRRSPDPRLLDPPAYGRRGQPFQALGAREQDDLLRRWERDPVLGRPLAIVSFVYKLVHFDEPPRKGLPLADALERPRWLQQVVRGDDWEGGDVECDAVIVGSGAGGGVVGRELAARGHAVVFVEEGQLHRRDAFDGSAVRAHQRFYRPAFSVGNVLMPIFVGRMVGGSTAINGGTCIRTPDSVLTRWC